MEARIWVLDPDPHQGEKSDPDSHQIKIRIRIRINVMRIHNTVYLYLKLFMPMKVVSVSRLFKIKSIIIVSPRADLEDINS